MTDEETPVEAIEVDVPDLDVRYDPVAIAQEVIAGHWGRGFARHRRLKEAGYDPEIIQKEVSKIFDQ